ncbi:MAG TPA: hypothetical protein DDZ89_11780 [Clostridiales bacterium]|nr:hypothetical protein [Clostridiales bacterium]
MNKIIKALKTFIYMVLILCVTVVGFVYGFLNKINRTDTHKAERFENAPSIMETTRITEGTTTTYTQTKKYTTPAQTAEITSGIKEYDLWPDKQIINIMLIGHDGRSNKEKGRSDTMILATLNVKEHSIQLTSFMRDLYVQIPGYKDNRINLSYQLGGMSLLQETIEKNFQIPVDGNIEVDFKAFEKAIDSIGGIDVELNTSEARYLGYEKAGTAHMDGRMALIYARLRAVGNCDYERTERQRKVLTAAFEKVTNMNPVKVIDLLNQCLPMVTTDMTNMEIIRLATKVLSVDYNKPETFRIPIDGAYKAEVIRGMEVLKPDLDKNRKALQESLYNRK